MKKRIQESLQNSNKYIDCVFIRSQFYLNEITYLYNILLFWGLFLRDNKDYNIIYRFFIFLFNVHINNINNRDEPAACCSHRNTCPHCDFSAAAADWTAPPKDRPRDRPERRSFPRAIASPISRSPSFYPREVRKSLSEHSRLLSLFTKPTDVSGLFLRLGSASIDENHRRRAIVIDRTSPINLP